MRKKEDIIVNTPMVEAVLEAYDQGQEDESLEPIVACDAQGAPLGRMENKDYVIFYDIRGEREVEITRSLTEKDFSNFPVKKDTRLHFVTMIEYKSDLNAKVAFPPPGRVKNSLGEVLSKKGIPFCKISESEKEVHVGYFFNGKSEKVFPGEERKVIPSPEGVASFSEKPEMSIRMVTQEIISTLDESKYRMVLANFANADVVGHSEDREAVIKAVESVDRELGKVVDYCQEHGVTLVVTADHGTVEEWLYPDGTINTGHTNNQVPFILADFSENNPKETKLRSSGELSHIAPTVLQLLHLDRPSEMKEESMVLNKEALTSPKQKVLLLILDGWGLNESKKGNMIQAAKTPHYDQLWGQYPHAKLQASGEAVGMPPGTVGNSEAGHLHIGAGRRILLDRVRIDRSIDDGSFFKNRVFLETMEKAKKENKPLHLLGIVSHYSSHGTIDFLYSLLKLAKNKGLKQVYVHSLIGRRGEKPESGAIYISKVEQMCQEVSVGHLCTIMGRFWALDREENWDRVEKAYRALVFGDGRKIRMKGQELQD
ncbi:MAG: sulfatase-like hydrolase/transferase [Candidatus Aminicenantes bacterium]|nr:sulfatase-like hydrolase/transferase [Candidatus Aminicenantes bacterium]